MATVLRSLAGVGRSRKETIHEEGETPAEIEEGEEELEDPEGN